MTRGTPISLKPQCKPVAVDNLREQEPEGERLLTTTEANQFLRRAKGFLEKRRSSGVDSPPYIQPGPGSAVRYRKADLLSWEDCRMRTSTSQFVR